MTRGGFCACWPLRGLCMSLLTRFHMSVLPWTPTARGDDVTTATGHVSRHSGHTRSPAATPVSFHMHQPRANRIAVPVKTSSHTHTACHACVDAAHAACTRTGTTATSTSCTTSTACRRQRLPHAAHRPPAVASPLAPPARQLAGNAASAARQSGRRSMLILLLLLLLAQATGRTALPLMHAAWPWRTTHLHDLRDEPCSWTGKGKAYEQTAPQHATRVLCTACMSASAPPARLSRAPSVTHTPNTAQPCTRTHAATRDGPVSGPCCKQTNRPPPPPPRPAPRGARKLIDTPPPPTHTHTIAPCISRRGRNAHRCRWSPPRAGSSRDRARLGARQ
jgi:hypothetical protein